MDSSEPDTSARRRTVVVVLFFLFAAALVFFGRTWPYWRGGELLPGLHADGPFHYYSELARQSEEWFPRDLAIQSNRSLGFYEYFYASVNAVQRWTGWSLMTTNFVICWAGNLLYLAGVMWTLRRLRVPPGWAALGVLISAQPFVLIGMWSGVVHSLAVTREVWLWPMPWFVGWFLFGRRRGPSLILFYGAMGLVFGWTYPLWAALFGLAFGLADLTDSVRRRDWRNLAWLAGAGAVCVALVAIPSLAMIKVVGGEKSALLEYNTITRSVFWTKGFRRLLLFAGLGFLSLHLLRRAAVQPAPAWDRARTVLIVSMTVCVVYEPLQRLFPVLSLLHFGRLSLVTYLIGMMAFCAALAVLRPRWSRRARFVAMAVVGVMLLDPQRSLHKEAIRKDPLPLRTSFIEFCERVDERTARDALFVVPPGYNSHYFRVYSRRGQWIDSKDTGPLSRSESLFALAKRRLAQLERVYDEQTGAEERERVLGEMEADGLNYLVTRTADIWATGLAWPEVMSHDGWQMRRPPDGP